MKDQTLTIRSVLIAAVVGSVMTALCLRFQLTASSYASKKDDWRRTANGWQKMSQWQPAALAASWRPGLPGAGRDIAAGNNSAFLHPAAVAGIELLSILALFASRPRRD